MKLREYQRDSVNKIVNYFNQPFANPKLFVAPVAAGKSIIIASVVKHLDAGVLILQPSKELLEQNYSKYTLLGGEASIYSASMNIKEIGKVTFATLGSIKKDVDKIKALNIKYLIIDEVHYGYPYKRGTAFYQFINKFKPTHCIGLTATPVHLISKAHKDSYITQLELITNHYPRYFTSFLDIIPIKDIVEGNFWSPLEYFPYLLNPEGLRYNKSFTDFTEESIQITNKANDVNNKIYLLIKNIINKKKGILVFMDSVETAEKMADLFGKEATCVSGSTPKKKRDQIIKDFKEGKIKVVTNYGVLTTGFDHPELDTIIIGRPTGSFSLYYQMVGRGTRLADGKTNCEVHDFGNNISRFGHIEDFQIEQLPKYGLQITSGDKIITGYPLREGIRRKTSIYENNSTSPKIPFGKYKDISLDLIPLDYLQFLIENNIVKNNNELYPFIIEKLNSI